MDITEVLWGNHTQARPSQSTTKIQKILRLKADETESANFSEKYRLAKSRRFNKVDEKGIRIRKRIENLHEFRKS